ncbi:MULTISPECIES: PilZ domain-containing protein [Bradyrhizobium]|uniref:PilZ domain-containing protein n=1 Tax=Bradyrhizobium TaxID=374 RepID=UPI001BA5136E|nr:MULTISPECIES: PilZ domain-containing protein [Bradyrhizobium]MBR0709546.1 PilZ domain-containing protein [Bradyrhizobium liaoningense]MDA9403312.1 pilus assembly protein PilZ [Bradyrhizobium sp. CCBAU 45389]
MIEKRAAQRHRVFKGGTISFEDGGIACTVRNMSESGAAIDLDGSVTLPQSFTLSIARDNFVRNCRPVWRNDKRIGLAFVQ